MLWIRNGNLKRITKDGRCFREADAMFFEIRSGLHQIPFEFHRRILSFVSVIRIDRHNAAASAAAAECPHDATAPVPSAACGC